KWALTETPADEDRAGARSFSAEKGYLREFGNLVFHLGIALLIIIVGLGRMIYYEGQVILLTNTGTEISDDNVNSAV
ncbi:cytochrome c biogenesis protein ResB, partial [Alloscardovia omnicolens]